MTDQQTWGLGVKSDPDSWGACTRRALSSTCECAPGPWLQATGWEREQVLFSLRFRQHTSGLNTSTLAISECISCVQQHHHESIFIRFFRPHTIRTETTMRPEMIAQMTPKQLFCVTDMCVIEKLIPR